MAQTRRSTARGLEQVPSRRLSAVPAEEAASAAARRGKRRGRIKYRIFTLGLGLDMTMLFLILVLLAVGLVMMFSASYAYAYYYYGNSYYFILRQGMFALVGVVLMLAISTFDYHQLHKLNLPIFAVSILLLLMVLVFKGTKLAPNKGGAVRWLNLGFVEFQPSEIAKFALILMFAHLIALYGERMKTFRYGFLPFFGILGLICVLVIGGKARFRHHHHLPYCVYHDVRRRHKVPLFRRYRRRGGSRHRRARAVFLKICLRHGPCPRLA